MAWSARNAGAGTSLLSIRGLCPVDAFAEGASVGIADDG